MFLKRAYHTQNSNTNSRARVGLVTIAFIAIFLIDNLLFNTINYTNESGIEASLFPANNEYTKAKQASLIIFYNLFIPTNDTEGLLNAVNVITDQMKQVSTALYRLEEKQLNNDSNTQQKLSGVVYYNLIGNNEQFTEMNTLCHSLHPRLDCLQLQHYTNATESVTLSSLYDYCHTDIAKENDMKRVVYLHSKGSFHDHGKQTPWRRALTNSSLHLDCLSPPNSDCDVCGAQYYTMFGSMFPGNMWTAKCSYIRKLLPPTNNGEYVHRKNEAIKQYLILKSENIVYNTLGWHQDVFFGLGRYINEHWVASHPSIQPCDMHSPQVGFWNMVKGQVKDDQYEWGMAPRRLMIFDEPESKPVMRRKNIDKWLSKNDTENFRQYYYLAGNMIKWITLYDSVPNQESWVWNHYPAGEMWKVHVAKYGVKSIDALIEQSTKSKYHSIGDMNHMSSSVEEEFDKILAQSNTWKT